MEVKKLYCHGCNKFVEKFGKSRRICEECIIDDHKKYYKENKAKIKAKYIPNGKPRGRPKKENRGAEDEQD